MACVRRDRQGRTRATPARYPQVIAPTLNGMTLGWNGSLPDPSTVVTPVLARK